MANRVFKYGDSVDTDVILPARYLALYDPKDLAVHCLEDLDADFSKNVHNGDVIVAGENFGCGSSREHAPIAIQSSGICCVIAASFARIFYRNAINIGLPIIENAEAARSIQNGDEVIVDFKTGEIKDLTLNRTFKTSTFPEFIQNIINEGGLLSSIQNQNK